MTDITIVKTSDYELPENYKGVLKDFLFGGYLDGMSEADKSAWRKFWGRLIKLSAGELANISCKVMRNGKFHRKFFAMLNVGFEAWNPNRVHKTYKGIPIEKDFEQFREDVTILAGFYEQTFDLNGHLKLKAKSISFANMDDDEFEHVYSSVADVLLQKVLINYKGREELDEVVEKILRFL